MSINAGPVSVSFIPSKETICTVLSPFHLKQFCCHGSQPMVDLDVCHLGRPTVAVYVIGGRMTRSSLNYGRAHCCKITPIVIG